MTNRCWVLRDYNGEIKLFSNKIDAMKEFDGFNHIWKDVFEEEIQMSDEVHLDMTYRPTSTVQYDNVNHPAHYCEGRKYEPWDVILDWGLDYLTGTAVKYLSRAGRKDPFKEIEDLNKAKAYIDKRIEQLQG